MCIRDRDCTKQLATLTTDENGNTDIAEVKAGTVYIKELSAPAGYKVDKTVYSLKIEAGKTATLNVSDTPKVTAVSYTHLDVYKRQQYNWTTTIRTNAI